MFQVLRRGPALIGRPFFSRPSSKRCIQSITHRYRPSAVTRIFTTVLESARAYSTTQRWAQLAYAQRESALDDFQSQPPASDASTKFADQNGPVTKFKDLEKRGMVCRTLIDTVTGKMGLETMTHVQTLTINESLKGIDILAQARTGTGKTLAFLIPLFQNLISHEPSLEQRGRHSKRPANDDVRAIIISPTRELAEQIATEARSLAAFTGLIVQVAVGGNSKSMMLQKMRREGCHVLVGTPGRLNDLLSDQYSGVRAPRLSALVLDEADRLLDQGFAPEIESIQRQLPDRAEVDRQTLLFSATVPQGVMQIVRQTAKPNYKYVRTVQEGEQQTHERVPQKLVKLAGFENSMAALVELAKREIGREGSRPFKAIVYFNASAEVKLASSVLRNLRSPTTSEVAQQHPLYPAMIFEIHAKLSQPMRTRAADRFRRAKSAILLSTDVTARGMDFPDVTHVIQIGLPPSRESYIHRLGRTGRAGKEGEGWLFITDLEYREGRSILRGLPLGLDSSVQTANVDMSKDASLPENTANILTQVINASQLGDPMEKLEAYKSALGSYGWLDKKQELIDLMNNRARYCWGMETPPPIPSILVNKLGLRRIHGINTSLNDDRFPREPPRDGFNDRDGRSQRDDRSTNQYGSGSRGNSGFNRNDRFNRSGSSSRYSGVTNSPLGGYGRNGPSSYEDRGSSRGDNSYGSSSRGGRSYGGSYGSSSSSRGGGYAGSSRGRTGGYTNNRR